MKCKKCEEEKINRLNESKKYQLVNYYFKRWIWWLLIVGISVCSSMVYIFNQSVTFNELGTLMRISLVTCWAFTVITMAFISFPKCGGGLLSLSAMFFIIGSLSGFEEPIISLAALLVTFSIFYLLIKVLIGIRFEFDINVKELPWFVDRSGVRNIKTKRNGRKK